MVVIKVSAFNIFSRIVLKYDNHFIFYVLPDEVLRCMSNMTETAAYLMQK